MPTVKRLDRIFKSETKIYTIAAGALIADAAKIMQKSEVGSLLVTDADGKLLGIVTERDVVAKVVAKSANADALTVSDIMTKALVCCTSETPAEEARRIMNIYGIRHLPIVEDGVPVGMVSSRDILAHELSFTKSIVRKQSRILQQLEDEHPGITQLQKDDRGRIKI